MSDSAMEYHIPESSPAPAAKSLDKRKAALLAKSVESPDQMSAEPDESIRRSPAASPMILVPDEALKTARCSIAKQHHRRMVHKEQPKATMVSGINARGTQWVAAFDAVTSSSDGPRQFIGVKSTYHDDQPLPEPASKSLREVVQLATIESWQNVAASYSACRKDIQTSPELQNSRAGRQWMGIIERRASWMTEDQAKLKAAIDHDRQMSWPVDERGLRHVFRRQEDRLRRLRARAIELVVEKPSRVDKEYRERLTFDEKIQYTLRDVYDECTKARKAFCREVDKAEAECQSRRTKENTEAA